MSRTRIKLHPFAYGHFLTLQLAAAQDGDIHLFADEVTAQCGEEFIRVTDRVRVYADQNISNQQTVFSAGRRFQAT